MVCNPARPRKPDMRTVSMRLNMPKRAPQPGQPERPADNRRVEGGCTHKRLACRPAQHFVELVDDHAGEVAGRFTGPRLTRPAFGAPEFFTFTTRIFFAQMVETKPAPCGSGRAPLKFGDTL